MQITGTFTTAAASGYMQLAPSQSLFLGLTVAAGLTFSGRVVIERSRDGLETWQRVDGYDYDGRTVALTAGVQAGVQLTNQSAGREYYRLRNLTASGADGLEYVIARNAPNASVEDHLDDITISAANITGTAAGQLGHASGVPLVAAPGADVGIEFMGGMLMYQRSTASYGAGGLTTVNLTGGVLISKNFTAAGCLGAASDKVIQLYPVAMPDIVITPNTGLSLVTTVAFTNPGTAAGVLRLRIRYRLHQLGLL